MPALTFVRLYTADGAEGLGETFYTPQSVSAYVHEVLAPLVLGQDVTVGGWDWEDLYGRSARRIPGGVDMRALSAVDLAVWDLRGRVLGRPVSDLLGAVPTDGALVYNTCAGAKYASATSVSRGQAAGHDDLWMAQNDPGTLAAELVEEGFTGMKLWPFDAAARSNRGARISTGELAAGVAILSRIREAVGGDLEIMLEGHGLWQPSAAERILNAISHLDITWAEDMVLAHDPGALSRLAGRTPVPLAASEYVGGRWAYRQLLENRAIGFLHLDPSWCGGISEAQQILALSSAFGVTASMHDCTGPINLLAGVHLARANPIVGYQEVLRAFLTEVYPALVDTTWTIENGRMRPPDRPGIGAQLTPDFVARAQTVASVA
jgi:L-alanine-DL-glutamate epimerase-like enolase superfamily enzyme